MPNFRSRPKLARLAFAALLTLGALVSSARAAEPSAVGLWEKVQDGKPVIWVLVSGHDGTYEVVVADPRLAAPDVTRGLVGAGADVVSIGEAQHSLEDVYLELVNEDVEAQRP